MEMAQLLNIWNGGTGNIYGGMAMAGPVMCERGVCVSRGVGCEGGLGPQCV